MFPDEAAFRDVEEELIAQALDVEHPWLAGVTKERLEREGHVALALPQDELPFSSAKWFRTPSGRGELTPLPVWTAPSESRNGAERSDEFPLEFLPRKADNYMNTTFANLPQHQQMERKTAGVLEMHSDDAAARGLKSGDAVAVWNQRGRITLTARVGDSIAAGVVAARLDWHKLSANGANVNTLTSERLTDIGGGATFYSTMVEVASVEPVAAD
jgi:anaerobic selenocysteine-containing dehydrogenase